MAIGFGADAGLAAGMITAGAATWGFGRPGVDLATAYLALGSTFAAALAAETGLLGTIFYFTTTFAGTAPSS